MVEQLVKAICHIHLCEGSVEDCSLQTDAVALSPRRAGSKWTGLGTGSAGEGWVRPGDPGSVGLGTATAEAVSECAGEVGERRPPAFNIHIGHLCDSRGNVTNITLEMRLGYC